MEKVLLSFTTAFEFKGHEALPKFSAEDSNHPAQLQAGQEVANFIVDFIGAAHRVSDPFRIKAR